METAKAIEIWTENIRLIRERQSGVWAQRRVCAEELAELVWSNLTEDNKVSLFVRTVPLNGGEPTEIIINKNK